jgi:hypothetical protein
VAGDDTLKTRSVVKIVRVLADTTLHQTRGSCPKNKIKLLYFILQVMLLHGDTLGLHLPLQPGYCSQHSEYAMGLMNRGSNPPEATDLSLFQKAQTSPGVHPTSYSMGNGNSLLGNKAAGVQS